MDISGIPATVSGNKLASSATAGASFHHHELVDDAQKSRHDPDTASYDKSRNGLALGIFKQELQLALKAHFHAKFFVMQQGYTDSQGPLSTDDVAEEALGAAKQLVAEEPVKAANSLISFRAKVEETASYVRQTVSSNADVADVDEAKNKLDQGLSKLESEVESNRESTASVLSVDTQTKQRSIIQIRTQEGDSVKLSLKRIDSLSASDLAYEDNEISAGATEVAVSSQSRIRLKIEGDLNESEMAAIQNVIAKAESIANEFFGGDLSSAFNIAQGFEFDTGQLARVYLGFRMHQTTNLSYAEAYQPATIAPVVDSAEAQAPSGPLAEATNTPGPAATSTSNGDSASVEPAVAADSENAVETTVPVETVDSEEPIVDTLSRFFEQLNAFMRSVGEGFSAGSTGTSYQFHYSESFKFSMLKAVMHTVAPVDSENAAGNAGLVIDQVSEGSELEDDLIPD